MHKQININYYVNKNQCMPGIENQIYVWYGLYYISSADADLVLELVNGNGGQRKLKFDGR